MSDAAGKKQRRSRQRKPPATPAPIAVIVGHGELPRALRDAALSIIPDPEAIVTISNEDLDRHELDHALQAVADRHPGTPLLVFADMHGSSCCQAGTRLKATRPDVELASGANMPMLVRFLQYRRKKTFSALARLMHTTARQESLFD